MVRVPGFTVLAHPDLYRIGEQCSLDGLITGQEIRLSRLEPLFTMPGQDQRRALADPHLSRTPIRLLPMPAQGVRLLTSDTRTPLLADGAPVGDGQDFSFQDLQRGVVLLLANRVTLLFHLFDPTLRPDAEQYGLVGESEGIALIRREIHRVAEVEVPVLIRGETGTGKDLVANAIHQASERRAQPFVAVNMSSIPPTLAAAELFGAVKGAFTGADRHRSGYFQRAHGGTLFLDEIGDTPTEVQALLLRTLETGIVQPVGSETPRKVDVRILAATDADLESALEAGRFRAPLLHRLCGFAICIPPLRERLDDLGRLLYRFLLQELEALGDRGRAQPADPLADPWLPAPLVARLASYSWPGNVRQLRNVARHLVIGNRGAARLSLTPTVSALLVEPAPSPGRTASAPNAMPSAPVETAEEVPRKDPQEAPQYRPPAEVTEEELMAVLRAHQFRLQPAAAALGISRTSLYARIDRSPHVRKARDLSREEIEHCRQRHDDLDAMAESLEVSRKALRRRMTQLGLP